MDAFLHRNRLTLEKLFSENENSKVLNVETLKELGFHFEYITQMEVTPEGELIRVIYDYVWRYISDREVLIEKMKVAS